MNTSVKIEEQKKQKKQIWKIYLGDVSSCDDNKNHRRNAVQLFK